MRKDRRRDIVLERAFSAVERSRGELRMAERVEDLVQNQGMR